MKPRPTLIDHIFGVLFGSARKVLDELLSDEVYRPMVMSRLRFSRDWDLRASGYQFDPATITEEWWTGDGNDSAAFIRNREPKRLEWT